MKRKYWKKVIGLIEENARYHAAFMSLKARVKDMKDNGRHVLLDEEDVKGILAIAGLSDEDNVVLHEIKEDE